MRLTEFNGIIAYQINPAMNRINKMKKIFFIGLLSFSLVGCSYYNKLNANITTEENNNPTKPFILAIDGSNISGSQMSAKQGAINYNVQYGDALLQLIKQKNMKNFKDVYILHDINERANYDYILTVKNNIASKCGIESCNFSSSTSLDIKKNINDTYTLLTSKFIDQYVLNCSDIGLRIISGMTFCIVCPITLPAIANMRGDEISEQMHKSNDRISTRIAEILFSSDIFENKPVTKQ